MFTLQLEIILSLGDTIEHKNGEFTYIMLVVATVCDKSVSVSSSNSNLSSINFSIYNCIFSLRSQHLKSSVFYKTIQNFENLKQKKYIFRLCWFLKLYGFHVVVYKIEEEGESPPFFNLFLNVFKGLLNPSHSLGTFYIDNFLAEINVRA